MKLDKPERESHSLSRIYTYWSVRTKLVMATASISALVVGATGVYLLASGARSQAVGVVIEPAEATISGESAQQIEFTLTNRNATAINVARVNTSCGCTVVKAPNPSRIIGGASAKLTARAAPPSWGEKLVRIEVYLDSDVKPVVAKLTLKGREPPIPSLNWQPREVVARGKLGEHHVENFELVTTEQKGAQPWIKAATCDSPAVKVELSAPKEERGLSSESIRRKYEVSVAVDLEKTGRIRLGSISLQHTSSADGPAPRQIVVFSDCRPSVESAPDTIFASVSRDELPKEFVVRFRAPSMSSSLELTAEPVEFSWLDIGEPKQSKSPALFCAELPIRITAPPSEEGGGPRRTTVRLRTNAPDCPLVEIPVYVQMKQ